MLVAYKMLSQLLLYRTIYQHPGRIIITDIYKGTSKNW